ncbi:uncharacterized protein FPRO_00507 [Fusarium proliferatum ET1]|uniref:Uncharacterized protein n=1 Tax=Fusarium proliferatum (strain ET1) TaxID=1227346 RepID=A0A1L7V7Y6_FUSPR|nr:uncharacterized protein FPRO_00507 [Fusarium proliferatum ET1]CZR35370.1 uncharacterized protein FPRO_00507 [Fusarium proliferatum ET1]
MDPRLRIKDDPYTSSKGSSTEREDSATAMKYKSLLNQPEAFICGTAPVIFLSMDLDLKKRDHNQIQVAKTLATLPYYYQRSQPVFCERPDSILIDETGVALLVCKVVNDDLERDPNVVPLKTYRFLDSKLVLGWKYNRL